jgi:hypothetical protein
MFLSSLEYQILLSWRVQAISETNKMKETIRTEAVAVVNKEVDESKVTFSVQNFLIR